LKRNAIAFAAAVMLATQAFAAVGTWNKSLVLAQKKAKDANQLIFVDMFADWCGWCHKMEQEVFPSAAFQNATDDMILLRLNTEDGGEGSRLAQRLQVTQLPTFLLLTSDGMVAGVIHGFAPADEFVKSLKQTQASYHDFEMLVKSEPTFGNDYQKRLDLARGFAKHYGLAQSEVRFKKLVTERGVPVSIRDQAYYELAASQVLQNKFDDATKTITAFSKVQSKGEPYERARYMQGQIYLEQGNLNAAAAELRSFKARFPGSPLMRWVDMTLPDIERRLGPRK
jgi:thioredoxin-related protein